jgi:hypothetical protein
MRRFRILGPQRRDTEYEAKAGNGEQTTETA